MVKRLSNAYLYLILIFLYAPIVVLVLLSFNDSRLMKWGGFTLRWYREILREDILNALWVTITIAILATVIATIFGTITAIGIHYLTKRLRRQVITTNNIPIVNPEIVTAISLMILFTSIGSVFNFKLNFWTMLMAHVIFDTPYVILSVLTKLKQLNPNVFEAALDLGASPRQAISKIIIPQLTPGIITGAMIAFTMSVDDFVISYFTTGSGIQNLSIWIFNQTKRGVTPAANAISTMMLLIVITLLAIIFIRIARDIKKKEMVK